MSIFTYRHPAAAGSAPATVVSPYVTSRLFRGLVLVTLIAVFGLVTLGGVVRATDSGLGCPDWPLCAGTALVPGEIPAGQEAHNTYLELSHRVVAGAVGLLVVAVAVVAWRNYRQQRWVYVPAVLGVVLLVVQALMGGVTVLMELPRWAVMSHLAMAQGMIAVLLVVYVASGRFDGGAVFRVRNPGLGGFPAVALATAAATFGMIMLGSYVANTTGATYICGDSWPLCRGELLPRDELSLVHMGHRAASFIVGALMAMTVAMAWQNRRAQPHQWFLALSVGLLFVTQVLVGAANMWLNFPAAVRAAHLSVATMIWMHLASMAIRALWVQGSLVSRRPA